MGKIRSGLRFGIAIGLLTAVAMPTGAMPVAARTSVKRLTTNAVTHRLVSQVTDAARRGAVPPRVKVLGPALNATCYQYKNVDPVGDTSGVNDITNVAMGNDCVNGNWVIAMATRRPYADQDFVFSTLIDTDGNNSNNCVGFDAGVIAFWDSSSQTVLSASTLLDSNCDTFGIAGASYSRTAANAAEITFSEAAIAGPPRSYTVSVWGTPDATNAEIDDAPRIPGVFRVFPTASNGFTESLAAQQQFGVYTRGVPGDFNGDGHDDIFWYALGTTPEVLSLGDGTGAFSDVAAQSMTSQYTIRSGDFDGDGFSDLFLLGPGTNIDAIRFGGALGVFTPVVLQAINATYQLIVGDYNADGYDDILFYTPGVGHDYLWSGRADRTFTKQLVQPISSTYTVISGNFDGVAGDDLLFYVPGTGTDYLWRGQTDGSFLHSLKPINGTYAATAVGDFSCDGREDVLFYNPNTATDALVLGQVNSPYLSVVRPTVINETYAQQIVGDYNEDGCDDVYLYTRGLVPERMWFGHA